MKLMAGVAPQDVPRAGGVRAAVAAASADVSLHRRAETLSREFGLALAGAPTAPEYDWMLLVTGQGLELRCTRDPRLGAVSAGFTGVRPGRGRQLLARALGRGTHTVVDATAGLGQDAFRLAAFGYRVVAIERVPAVAALLADGLRRARQGPQAAVAERVTLRVGDARALLPGLAPPDAVYLDPMFPPKRKRSAAPRKEARALRALAGDDGDAAALLAVARRCARRRVVVKRPDDAAPLAAAPDLSFAGKLVRYDVYLTPPVA